LFGAFKHLDDDDKRQLTIELISNEALKTPVAKRLKVFDRTTYRVIQISFFGRLDYSKSASSASLMLGCLGN